MSLNERHRRSPPPPRPPQRPDRTLLAHQDGAVGTTSAHPADEERMVTGRTYLAIRNVDGDVRTSGKRLDLAQVAAVPHPRTATHGAGSRPEIAKQ
ncbi:hypothetical protein [Streptomyces sp. NPDC057460]|uniref:hypothetical protein n=1 Tax=Streptomyces sp. NPDC057460 TaxID=3346141 RepID=UPI0036AAC7FC